MRDKTVELMALLGEPDRSVTPVPWHLSRAEVGMDFPADFRGFVDRFGGGQFRRELAVHSPTAWASPGSPNGFERFILDTTEDGSIGDYLAGAYEDGDYDECPHPVYPEPGGLLLWGNTWNADQLFWLTEGEDPDKWPVAIWYRQLAEWDTFDGGFAAFSLALITGAYPMAHELLPSPDPEVPEWETHYDWDHPSEGMVIEGW